MNETKLKLLAKSLAAAYVDPGDPDYRACACIGSPPCDILSCPKVWESLLENPKVIRAMIKIYSIVTDMSKPEGFSHY